MKDTKEKLQIYLDYAKNKRNASVMDSNEYAFWNGFHFAISNIVIELEEGNGNPFKDIPNPLENEYIISG